MFVYACFVLCLCGDLVLWTFEDGFERFDCEFDCPEVTQCG